MAVTLKHIANKLSVNVSTVSRAINKRSRSLVNEKTCRRILDTAGEMGYEMNHPAQALVRGRTGCVGVLLPDLETPTFVRYANALNGLLREQNLRMIPLVYHQSGDDERQFLLSLRRKQVDAVICFYYHDNLEPLYQSLRQQGYYLIFRPLDMQINEIDYDCVGTDLERGYEVMVKHLIDRGYRKIGIVGGGIAKRLAEGLPAGRTGESFLKGFSDAGIEFDPARAIPCGDSSNDACRKLTEVLRCDRERFDALVVYSDKLIVGVWRALQLADLSVPQQVGVVTHVDSEYCRTLDVTVWEQPVEQISESMIQILDARLKGRKELTKIQYASWLIERESSRGPQKVSSR